MPTGGVDGVLMDSRWGRGVGIACVAVLSWFYCRPGHLSAGDAPALDALAHCGVFAAIGYWYARAISARLSFLLPLVALAVALEWLQWWRGDYARVEWADIAWNVGGVLLGWALARARK